MADQTEKPEDILAKEAQEAWQALTPLRETWDEKEEALIAKVNDSFSGNVTTARVTDAALSTLAFERQARVAAQMPTGKVYATGKKDDGKAKIANIVLNRYIIPNANAQKDLLVKDRLWGIYASVFGSMPMLVDYRVDDQYIGPDCWLIDPRSFLPQPGRNSIQEMDWCMVSTIYTVSELQEIANRKTTSWNKASINRLIKQAKKGKPSRFDDADKDSVVSSTRYRKDLAKGQVEIITKYENGKDGKWITFAPDYKDVGVLRDIKNPHKSNRIPIFMRDCFPLMNSLYGLGDFERGMRIQKAKDSLLGLRLEYVKNSTFPPLKINTSQVTASTIKYGNRKWLVKDMNNSVQPVQFGNQSANDFQSVFSVLSGMQQSQFGTSDARVSGAESADPSVGKTPAAIKQNERRENARDNWDRFMYEKAVEQRNEYMINLLKVKMEKPINFIVFEEEINQIAKEHGDDVLSVIAGNKVGNMTVSKKLVHTDNDFKYMVDANSSMLEDDQSQLEALLATYNMAAQDPTLAQDLMSKGQTWDKAEHFKKILIASGLSDWEKILPEDAGQDLQGQMPQDPNQAQGQDPMMQQQMMQEQAMQEQAMMQQQQEQAAPAPQMPQFQDPDIAAYAQQIMGGA